MCTSCYDDYQIKSRSLNYCLGSGYETACTQHIIPIVLLFLHSNWKIQIQNDSLSQIHQYIQHTYMFVVANFDAMSQASDFRIQRRQVVFPAECRIRSWEVWDTKSPANWLPTHKSTDWAIEDQVKTWTQQPDPTMSEHSAHLTSLPTCFRTWLWRYTCLLLLILVLWHRQATFESKEDRLSSSECRIRSWEVWVTKSPPGQYNRGTHNVPNAWRV